MEGMISWKKEDGRLTGMIEGWKYVWKNDRGGWRDRKGWKGEIERRDGGGKVS